MNIVNLAHGEFYMLGGYLFYTVLVLCKVPLLGAIPLAFLGVLLGGYLFERGLVRPLRNESLDSSMLMTIGLSILLQNLALLVWGGEAQTVPPMFHSGSVRLGPVVLSSERLWVLVTALAIIAATHLFIMKTRIGRGIRATFQDRAAAETVGINIERINAFTFAFGAALASAGGILLAPIYLITPTMGTLAVGKAFTVVIIGGLGSINGAIFGGFLLGIVESLGAGYISSGYKDAFGFLVIILVLVLKPSGLLGRRA